MYCSFTTFINEGDAMKIPIETTAALWGIAGGAADLAILGLTWGRRVSAGRYGAVSVRECPR